MRLRFAVLASLLATLALAAVPAVGSAHPRHNRGLTIHVTPKPIIAGEGVLIYGQLDSNPVAGQTIVLYHRLAGTHFGFTRIGETTTDSHGFYEFTRAEGVVETNRSWFAKEAGIHGIHSRTIHERVAALVSLAADKTSADTRQPIEFSGHVDPNHASERVFLQQQVGASDNWKTIESDRLGAGSNYLITHRFRVEGVRDVRVLFRGDRRNVRSASDPVTVTIQQAQVPDFTINSSDQIIQFGQSESISGTLYMNGTTTPEPNTAVTLCSRATGDAQFTCNSATVTGSDGTYSFGPLTPVSNQVYFVETTLAPHRHTARLFEGVRDAVTLSASASAVQAGQPVTFSGTATPDKAGDVVYLQRLGADGDWHTVGAQTIKPDSTYAFTRVFGTAGTKTFRARIPGDGVNVGGASAPVNVTVTLPPVSALPQGS
jgi:hypothetical protein